MGQSRDIVQEMQLSQGRQDPGRGRDETLAKLERYINNYLMDCYIMKELELGREDLASYGLDLSIVDIVYGGFKKIIVGDGMVTVLYSY